MGYKATVILIITMVIQSLVFASDVIDLGSLQVEGEVRRPPVQFFISKDIPQSIVQKSAEKSFLNLEEELLVQEPHAKKPSSQQNKKEKGRD